MATRGQRSDISPMQTRHIEVNPSTAFRREVGTAAEFLTRSVRSLREADLETFNGSKPVEEIDIKTLEDVTHVGKMVEGQHVETAYRKMVGMDEDSRRACELEVVRAVRKLLVERKVHTALSAVERFEIPTNAIRDEAIEAIHELVKRTYDYESMMASAYVVQALVKNNIISVSDLKPLEHDVLLAVNILIDRNMISGAASIKVAFGISDEKISDMLEGLLRF